MKKRAKFKLVAIIIIIIFLPAFGLKGCLDKETQQKLKPVTLNYWRVWDGPDAFASIISSYKQTHPNVTINYRKFRYEEYENELLNAFAEDRGPDIFSIHNTWVKKYESKIEPMPAKISMVYPVVKGTLKKEVQLELRTTNSLTVQKLEDTYIDTIPQDVVASVQDEKTKKYSEKILALPLALDTLVMYYNKDLMNNAGIINVPQYWDREFQLTVKKLTKQDTKGKIIQSGVALGGSTNIERFSDILSVLMMQNGTIMMSNSGNVSFNLNPSDSKYNPGLEALRFYTDFANPAKEVYCWNSSLENSLDLFIQGKLAIMFGYAYHLPTIKARAKKLNFDIAPLPQIEGNPLVNYANYWVETVSKKSQNADVAWDFIQFAAKEKNVKSYLEATNKPTVLRALIEEQQQDPDLEVFANQILTAKSWYRGEDANAAELIFAAMIDDVNSGKKTLADSINFAAKQVQQTVDK